MSKVLDDAIAEVTKNVMQPEQWEDSRGMWIDAVIHDAERGNTRAWGIIWAMHTVDWELVRRHLDAHWRERRKPKWVPVKGKVFAGRCTVEVQPRGTIALMLIEGHTFRIRGVPPLDGHLLLGEWDCVGDPLDQGPGLAAEGDKCPNCGKILWAKMGDEELCFNCGEEHP